MKDLADIVCEIAGPVTQRTLENLRRSMEEMFIQSTAQGATSEDQAVFSPTMIAQAHEAAKQDNARMIVAWAKAIYDELHEAEPESIATLRNRLAYACEKERFFTGQLANLKEGNAYPTLSAEERERQTEITQHALQQAQEEMASLEKSLRYLLQSQATVPGCPPQTGSEEIPPRHHHLDGNLPPVS